VNEAEIIAAMRQLATDLADFGPSPISKDTAMQLARSAEGTEGGSLVQWWNREDDHRRKLALREAITLVTKAGYMQKPEAIPKAIEQLPRICDRLELPLPEAKQVKPYPQPKLLLRDRFIWESIRTMSKEQLIQALENKKNFGLRDTVTTPKGFKDAALRYSQYHKLPTRNFRSETPYLPSDTD
jgi:hypothetical protein